MDKAWAKSGLTFEDEQWAFRRSEDKIEKVWKQTYKVVNSETKKFMKENENWMKNTLLVGVFMEGFKEGRLT